MTTETAAPLKLFQVSIAVLATVIIVGALAGIPAWASDGEGDSSLQEKAEALLDRVDQRLAYISQWTQMEKEAEGEDRRAIAIELNDKRLLVLADLGRLADNITTQEKKGLDASALRQRVEPLMLEIPDRIRVLADEAFTEATKLRVERENVSPEKLLDLEQKLVGVDERINRIAQACFEHTASMKALGLDTASARSWLLDVLTKRATLLGRRLELARLRSDELLQELDLSPEDPVFKQELEATNRRIDGDVHDLRVALKLLNTMGVDTTEQKRQLAQATGELADLMDKDVAVGLIAHWWSSTQNWLKENGVRLVTKAIVFLAILLAFRVLAWLARRIAVRSLGSSKVKTSHLLQDMILSMVQRIVMFFGLLIALSQLGIQLGPLLAGLGVVGFIVGFALQDVLSNFASGVMILFYAPFDVGDAVEVAGVVGKVNRMTLVSTSIRTFDNQLLVVPNTKIWGDVIKNITAEKVRRVDMMFGISYEDDIPRAEQVLLEIVKNHAKVLQSPEPVIKLHQLGESSVDFIVRPWVKTEDYWDVHWDVTREVKLRFDKDGISIPYPQRDVHLHGQAAKVSAA